MLTLSASCAVAGVLSVAACTHTTDRVVEPAGASDASAPSPELSDAGLSPLGPIANPIEPIEPAEDYRLVRSPEFGASVRYDSLQTPGFGGASGNGGSGGMGGSDHRPVGVGGSYY